MSEKDSCNSGIGGQALMEGIMMRNRDRYSVAVRKTDNEIVVKTQKYSDFIGHGGWTKIPIVRGVISFIDSLVTGIKCLLYSATFFTDDEDEETKKAKEAMSEEELKETLKKEQKKENAMLTGILLFAIVLAVILFVLVPYALTALISNFLPTGWLFSLIESLIRIGVLFGYLFAISKMKDIQRTFMYHGAEHKCINCLEHGMPLTVDNVRASSKEHKRCGTSFLFFVVIVSAIVLLLIRTDDHVTRLLIRLLVIPLVAGISYEIIRWAGRSSGKVVTILSKPGLALQGLTTKEPDDSMIEVGISSVDAVFDWRQFLIDTFDYRFDEHEEVIMPEYTVLKDEPDKK